MSKFTLFFWPSLFIGLTSFAFFASSNGLGLNKPTKKPMSIREESVKGTSSTRTRYFMGGGVHFGK